MSALAKGGAGRGERSSLQTLMLYDSHSYFSILLLVVLTIQHLMEEKDGLKGLQYLGYILSVSLFSIIHNKYYQVIHEKAHVENQKCLLRK